MGQRESACEESPLQQLRVGIPEADHRGALSQLRLLLLLIDGFTQGGCGGGIRVAPVVAATAAGLWSRFGGLRVREWLASEAVGQGDGVRVGAAVGPALAGAWGLKKGRELKFDYMSYLKTLHCLDTKGH